MQKSKKHSGFAIAIAWPETFCKQSNSWYDPVTSFLGINKNHYYKVGHAALVLVDSKSSKCHYFDFGRYHTPVQHGRVRSENTDSGLKMEVKAKISGDGNVIENYQEILTPLQKNQECHGEGKLHASYTKIDFKKALQKAKHLQNTSPIPYGPFRYKGSNCSRFVNKAILAGKVGFWKAFRLIFFVPLTPTPMNNVNALGNKVTLPKMLNTSAFCPRPITDKSILAKTLVQPERPVSVSDKAQWLSGDGAGSWFEISLKEKFYIITRYSPEGKIECKGIFEISNNKIFDIQNSYSFYYLSHCQRVSIKQNDGIIEFSRVEMVLSVQSQKEIFAK